MGKAESNLRPPKVRPFKAAVDQLQDFALRQDFEGVLLGSFHDRLGWRATTCMIFDNGYTQETATEFMAHAELTNLGVLSCNQDEKPTEFAVSTLSELAISSECKQPLLLHFIRGKYKVQCRVYEFNAKDKIIEEVSADFITRRITGEEFQVLGTTASESRAGCARAAVTCFLISLYIHLRTSCQFSTLHWEGE